MNKQLKLMLALCCSGLLFLVLLAISDIEPVRTWFDANVVHKDGNEPLKAVDQ